MKWYVSGKITGNPRYREQFAAAAESLRAEGDEAINPAENPPQPSWSEYMAQCIPQVCAADGIAMLPNWRSSKGAKRERWIARLLGKAIRYL
jgi:Tfp pilus assembly protein PilX